MGRNERRRRGVIEDIGKVSIDLGKLVMGSIALGGILRGNITPVILIVGGVAASVAFIILGVALLAITKEV